MTYNFKFLISFPDAAIFYQSSTKRQRPPRAAAEVSQRMCSIG